MTDRYQRMTICTAQCWCRRHPSSVGRCCDDPGIAEFRFIGDLREYLAYVALPGQGPGVAVTLSVVD
jgi:hypothetical protein